LLRRRRRRRGGGSRGGELEVDGGVGSLGSFLIVQTRARQEQGRIHRTDPIVGILEGSGRMHWGTTLKFQGWWLKGKRERRERRWRLWRSGVLSLCAISPSFPFLVKV